MAMPMSYFASFTDLPFFLYMSVSFVDLFTDSNTIEFNLSSFLNTALRRSSFTSNLTPYIALSLTFQLSSPDFDASNSWNAFDLRPNPVTV